MIVSIHDDKLLMADYLRKEEMYSEIKDTLPEFDRKSSGITKDELDEFCEILSTPNSPVFRSIKDIRYRALKYCLKYEFEIDSFWKYIQRYRGVWK